MWGLLCRFTLQQVPRLQVQSRETRPSWARVSKFLAAWVILQPHPIMLPVQERTTPPGERPRTQDWPPEDVWWDWRWKPAAVSTGVPWSSCCKDDVHHCHQQMQVVSSREALGKNLPQLPQVARHKTERMWHGLCERQISYFLNKDSFH